jgi:sugar phosphate isomerase/epimerase
MAREWTRREILRGGVAASAALCAGGALGCGPQEGVAPHVPPLRLAYGGFTLGVQSFTLRHYTLGAALDIVRALGLSRIELELIPATGLGPLKMGEHLPVSDDAAAIDAALDECAQRGISISAHGVNPVDDGEQARALFAFAGRARIPVLTIAPSAGVLPELEALCAAQPGVRLAIHNHGPGLPWETVEEILAAIDGRHPSLGACVDTGHYIRSGIDPVAAIERFGARVHGVHLKDFVSAGAFAEGCILGDGALDLGGVFAALRDVEFSGALSVEYEENPENVVPDLVACLEAASEAAERVASG